MQKTENSKNPIWRVSKYLLNYKLLFFSTLLSAVLVTLIGLGVPQAVQYVIGEIIITKKTSDLLVGISVITAMYFFREVFNCLRIRINNTLEQKVLIDIRKTLHEKLLMLPVSFYDKRKSGDISSRVIEDVTNVERVILDGTEQGITALLTIIGGSLIIFMKEPLMAIFVLSPLPLLFLMGLHHAKMSRLNWREVRNSSGLLSSLLVEDIQGNRMIHAFDLTQREKRRFAEQCNDFKKKSLKAMFRWSIHGPSTSFIASLGLVAVIGTGSYLSMTTETFTKGELIALLMYSHMVYDPIKVMNSLNNLISVGRASGDRVFEIIDYPIDISSPEKPVSFPTKLPQVEYQNVSFRYDQRKGTISKLNLTLTAGKVTALVGHTGAGKSTIANLLLRYYDVDSGAITINGNSIKDFSLTGLRTNIGIVSQDPFLFDTSIRNNILVANENATDEAIIEALKLANIWDFVKDLPDGLDTLIGERGIRLSMGEKQRLTIARVFLKNPPILILDEATSSVDTLTEKKIQSALKSLTNDRTVLIIAHRLSTIKDADQIVVLKNGDITEMGNHQSLIAKKGLYSNLWGYQQDVIS